MDEKRKHMEAEIKVYQLGIIARVGPLNRRNIKKNLPARETRSLRVVASKVCLGWASIYHTDKPVKFY